MDFSGLVALRESDLLLGLQTPLKTAASSEPLKTALFHPAVLDGFERPNKRSDFHGSAQPPEIAIFCVADSHRFVKPRSQTFRIKK